MLMTEWYLVYSDYDGPTYRVVRPHYDKAGNQESWVDQNGVHTADYEDDKVMPISDPVEWKTKAGQVRSQKEVTSYRVMITTPALRQDLEGLASNLQVGAVNKETDGWRFIPWTDSHKSSRKGWPTPKAAIPRWVGKHELVPYPDKVPMKGYTRFHVYGRDGWYIGPIDASYARNALECAHDVYKGLSVWFVSSAPIKGPLPRS